MVISAISTLISSLYLGEHTIKNLSFVLFMSLSFIILQYQKSSHFIVFPTYLPDCTTGFDVLQVKVVTDAGLASHLDPTLLQPADGDTPALSLGQSPSPISLQGSAPPRDQDRFV